MCWEQSSRRFRGGVLRARHALSARDVRDAHQVGRWLPMSRFRRGRAMRGRGGPRRAGRCRRGDRFVVRSCAGTGSRVGCRSPASQPGPVVCGGGEVFGGSLQVVPPDGGSLCGDASEEVVDVWLAGVAGEVAVKSIDRAPMKRSRGFGEQVRQSSQQGRRLPDRGRGAESGEQRLAGSKVHQAPGAIEVKARPGSAADGRHREPASRTPLADTASRARSTPRPRDDSSHLTTRPQGRFR